jgi:hypothetical protein
VCQARELSEHVGRYSDLWAELTGALRVVAAAVNVSADRLEDAVRDVLEPDTPA